MKKILLFILLFGSLYSCDYSKIKEENKQLKSANTYLESKVDMYEQMLQVQVMKKYAVAMVKYQRCIEWTGDKCSKKETLYSASEVIDVPSVLSEDDKYRILDNTSFEGIWMFDDIVERELFVFDTYAEASRKRNEYK